MRSRLTILAVTLSCGSGLDSMELASFADEEALLIGGGDYCTEARLVVRSQAQWQAIWSQVVARRDPKPPAPTVDFATETVLFAAMGERPSSGYDIEFGSAVIQAGAARVGLVETSPGPSCVTLTVMTCPAAAVRITRWDSPVVFVPSYVIDPCG